MKSARLRKSSSTRWHAYVEFEEMMSQNVRVEWWLPEAVEGGGRDGEGCSLVLAELQLGGVRISDVLPHL